MELIYPLEQLCFQGSNIQQILGVTTHETWAGTEHGAGVKLCQNQKVHELSDEELHVKEKRRGSLYQVARKQMLHKGWSRTALLMSAFSYREGKCTKN